MRLISIAIFMTVAFGCGSGNGGQIPRYTLTDLGSLGGATSKAFAINDSGQVVGTASLPGDLETRPFIWQPDNPNGTTGHMVAISAPGITFGEARDINNSGRV